MSERTSKILGELDLFSPDSVHHVLEQIQQSDNWSQDEKLELSRALTDLFYHAHHVESSEMPKLALKIAKQVAKFGPDMIPFIFQEILDSDSESAIYYGKAIARTKEGGLKYLLDKLKANSNKDHDLINLLQSFSYFKIPDVVNAIPEILFYAHHRNYQVTAMALYSVGRIVQRISAVHFDEYLRGHMFHSIFEHLSNVQGLVRKNAARALGKMMRKGLLSYTDEIRVYRAFLSITGKDNRHSWDRAYIVRREAEDFLPYFRKTSPKRKKYEQSFRIITKRELCENTYHYEVEAPLVARKIQAGQFIILRPHEHSERIPISICGWDRELGTIHIIISGVGKTTFEINRMEPGDSFTDLVGPLGNRSELPKFRGTCVVIGGGYGTGAVIPTAHDLRNRGNRVIGIVGARDKEHLIMVPEIRKVCDRVITTTMDGSEGMNGMVTDALHEILEEEKVIYVLAIGPVPMMAAVSEMTRSWAIPTYVSLNAIMVDGTGMCGACRVTVANETKFACFHGPDFNGHHVDFENLMKRQKMFSREEKEAMATLDQ